MASGFRSLRRFNALFKASIVARPHGAAPPAGAAYGFKRPDQSGLGLPPAVSMGRRAAFLAPRAIPGVERIQANTYARAVVLAGLDGKSHSRLDTRGPSPTKNALNVEASMSLLPVLPQVLARVRHLFDLSCDPAAVHEGLRGMNDLAPGLQVPGTPAARQFRSLRNGGSEPYSGSKSRSALPARWRPGWSRSSAYPSKQPLPACPTRFLRQSACSPWKETSKAISARSASYARAPKPYARSRKHWSSGRWTSGRRGAGREVESCWRCRASAHGSAQYIAMRAMAWPDAFLPTDYGIKTALAPRTPRQITRTRASMASWRSYATINLWNSCIKALSGNVIVLLA